MSLNEESIPPTSPRLAWEAGDLTSNISSFSCVDEEEQSQLLEENRELRDEIVEIKMKYEVDIKNLTHQLENCNTVGELELEEVKGTLKVANERIQELEQEVLMEKMLNTRSINPSMPSNISSNVFSNVFSNLSSNMSSDVQSHSECVTALERKQKELDDMEVVWNEMKKKLEVSEGKLKEVEKKCQSASLPRKTNLFSSQMYKLNSAMESIDELNKKIESLKVEKEMLVSHNRVLEEGLEEKTADQESQLQTLKEKMGYQMSQLQYEVERTQEEVVLGKRTQEELVLGKRTLQDQITQRQQSFLQEKEEFSTRIENLQEELRLETNKNYDEKWHLEQELGKKLETEKVRRMNSESQLQMILDEKREVEVSLLDIQEDRNTIQTKLFDLTKEKEQLKIAKIEVEEVCDEFKDEADKTLGDYNKLAAEHAQLSKERDEYRERRDRALNTIAARNNEIEHKNKEIEDLKERVIKLEKYREDLVDRLTITCEQNKMYETDFIAERAAREEEVSKSSRRCQDMQSRIDALERDKKDLRDQLNLRAANQLRNYGPEDYDTATYVPRDTGGAGPYHK